MIDKVKNALNGTSWVSKEKNVQYSFKQPAVVKIRRLSTNEEINSAHYSIIEEDGKLLLYIERDGKKHEISFSEDEDKLILSECEGEDIVLTKVSEAYAKKVA